MDGAGQIDQIRRFNRTVTQRIGVLQDAYLARGRPLGQARLLWEIGPDGSELRALRSRLDLDSGYLSRLLRALEADGLLVVGPDESDGRLRTARLTPAGVAERRMLDQSADTLAASILEPLSTGQRYRLAAAMAEVERLLIASDVITAVTDPRHEHARRSLQSYYDELAVRFPEGFDLNRGIPATADDLTLPRGLLLVATLHGEPVGCGALKLHPSDGTAHLKRMWIAPAVRGLGLGRRLLAELEAQAAAHGAGTVRLETHNALTEAIALYRSCGYREVDRFNEEPYAHHWFEKRLLVGGEYWRVEPDGPARERTVRR